MRLKEPNRLEALDQCRVGPVPATARRALKRQRSRQMRRYARQDADNMRPKARNSSWYWCCAKQSPRLWRGLLCWWASGWVADQADCTWAAPLARCGCFVGCLAD